MAVRLDERPSEATLGWLGEDMAELSLLLPAEQAREIERLADALGLTVAQLVRQLLGEALTGTGRRVACPVPATLAGSAASTPNRSSSTIHYW